MEFDCTIEFKDELEKLIKKNSYKNLESLLIDFLFDKDTNFKIGVNLNQNDKTPYVKRRINGSGGYRLYYYYIIIDDHITLMFVHPKTGSEGFEAISKEKRISLLKDLFDLKKSNNLYKVSCSNGKLIFEHQNKSIAE